MRPTPAVPTPPGINGHWILPPLILHPFSGNETPETLLEGSKASLMLNGILPGGEQDRDDLRELMLRGRIQELRMLYFLGKDLLRWIDQCVDFVVRTPTLKDKGIRAQSFSAFLVETPPDSITRKLQIWGVSDQRSVFSRAIALTGIICDPPTSGTFTSLFLCGYHRFLDYQYVCFQNLEPFTDLQPSNFDVEIYASAEYSQMLAQQWEKEQ